MTVNMCFQLLIHLCRHLSTISIAWFRQGEPVFKKDHFSVKYKCPADAYTARHTWATLARESGAPISIISAGLGHTSEEMTRVYLKEFDQETLAQVNRIVTNLL